MALHLARLLAGAGHTITLADSLRYPIAAASQLGVSYARIPPFAIEADAASQALAHLIETQSIEVVIPTCEEVLHLASLWSADPPSATLFAPSFPKLVEAHNKHRFIEICRNIELEVPRTHLLESEDDVKPFRSSANSFVFKPVWSRFGSDVLLRPKKHSLRRLKPTRARPWVAQEFLDGTEVCVYALASAGELLALSAYRPLVRTGNGAAVSFEPVDPWVARHFVQTFVQATEWTGQVSFDLMELNDGRILPLECNPRATSGLHFFDDGAAFAKAMLEGLEEIEPSITAPQTVLLALLAYGLPKLLQKQRRAEFLDALCRSQDVLNVKGDPLSWHKQARSAAEFAGLALRHRISLERASTWGIEWNGAG